MVPAAMSLGRPEPVLEGPIPSVLRSTAAPQHPRMPCPCNAPAPEQRDPYHTLSSLGADV